MLTRRKRKEVEAEQGWVEEADTIPFIQFPADWQIKIMPPYYDVVIRYKIKLPSGVVKSVFLDSRCSLSDHFDQNGRPLSYWEVFPVGKKYGQCGKLDVDMLIKLISYEEAEGE
jgi:hypothetical protein